MSAPGEFSVSGHVWRFDLSKPLSVYYLNTVTHGLVSFPGKATRTLRCLADDNRGMFPQGRDAVHHEGYMDNIVSGASSLAEAIEKQSQLIKLLEVGGMSLRK